MTFTTKPASLLDLVDAVHMLNLQYDLHNKTSKSWILLMQSIC